MTQLHAIAKPNGPTRGDVVFVHGLDGAWDGTWRHPNGFSWPEEFAQDINGLQVWSAEYPSASFRWIGKAMTIAESARSLLRDMLSHGVGSRPLLFITHSLGGLVVKRALVIADERAHPPGSERILAATRGVAFLGVPHEGAALPDFVRATRRVLWLFGSALRATGLLDELSSRSEELHDIHDAFVLLAAEQNIQVVTFYETQPTRGVRVVSRASARFRPGADAIEIDENHVGLCKPQDRAARVYQECASLVRKCLENTESLTRGHPTTTPSNGIPSRVFVSYSERDKLRALEVVHGLEARGVSCWISDRDIPPGVGWANEIRAQIERARGVVLVFSEHANGSRFIMKELEHAVVNSKPILLFRLEEHTPSVALLELAGSRQWIDGFKHPLSQRLDELCGAVRVGTSAPPVAPAHPGPQLQQELPVNNPFTPREPPGGEAGGLVTWDFRDLFDYGSGAAGFWVTYFRIAGRNHSSEPLVNIRAQVIPQISGAPVSLKYQVGPNERVDTAEMFIEPGADFVLSAAIPSPPHAHGSHGYTAAEYLESLGGFDFVFGADGFTFSRKFSYSDVRSMVLAAEGRLGPKPSPPSVKKRRDK